MHWINKYYYIFIILVFSFLLSSNISIAQSGYTNIYAINRISDASIIKVPFRLFSQDFNAHYKQFSFSTKFGIEHKLKTSKWHDISSDNVDYKIEFREYYLSYFPSFGDIKIGKQLHAWGGVDANSPIDILNPIDYYYLFTDIDETKIGRESIVLDFYLDPIKIEFLVIPKHITHNIPSDDPDFPITLPAIAQEYQFLATDNNVEYGIFIQESFTNMDWTYYFFSGYDRTFNLYGANVFSNDTNTLTITDTIFSYRKTNMFALSNVSFIGDLTVRADFAYFETESGDQDIESRGYFGKHEFTGLVDYTEWISSTYFNVSGKYYQYCLQLEYGLPLEISFTSQLFGYETIEILGDFVDIDIPGFEIELDAKDVFFPGMGSSMATLCKKGLIFNFTKAIFDDTMEIQLTNLLDIKDKGQLHQLKLSYNIFDNLNISFLLYHGIGNRIKYPDITFIDEDGDGENDDEIDNETGKKLVDGDGIPDADMFDESLLYPFNSMEDFSHIRVQLKYFF